MKNTLLFNDSIFCAQNASLFVPSQKIVLFAYQALDEGASALHLAGGTVVRTFCAYLIAIPVVTNFASSTLVL